MLGTIILVISVAIAIAGIVWFFYASRKARALAKSGQNEDSPFYDGPSYRKSRYFGFMPVILAVIMVGFSSLYFQDPGEVAVIRNLGGSLAGSSNKEGIHFKTPWQDVVLYDIRSNTISFIGESEEDYVGGRALGPAITINDRGGASADMDVQVQYSLDPNAAIELYIKYGSQENFVRQVIAVGTRAYSRDVAGKIDTIDILTSRGDFSEQLRQALTEAWADDGVIVERVSVQDIRYPDSIKERYAEAQAAAIAKAKAENEQDAARVEAETKLIIAEGEANANKALQESLTPDIISMRYIDALEAIGAKGNLVVISDGSAAPLLNVQTK